MDCIFCKIILGDIPCDKIYETEKILAFKDIRPAATEHILVIPKIHIPDIDHLEADHGSFISEMLTAARDVAEIRGMKEKGYRLIINNGKAAGQEVFHLHLHILGGEDSLGPMLNRG